MFSCCKCVNKKSNKKSKSSDENNADTVALNSDEKNADAAAKCDDVITISLTDKSNDKKDDIKNEQDNIVAVDDADKVVKVAENEDSDVNSIVITSKNVISQETTTALKVTGNIARNTEFEVIVSPPSPQQKSEEVCGECNEKPEQAMVVSSDGGRIYSSFLFYIEFYCVYVWVK